MNHDYLDYLQFGRFPSDGSGVPVWTRWINATESISDIPAGVALPDSDGLFISSYFGSTIQFFILEWDTGLFKGGKFV